MLQEGGSGLRHGTGPDLDLSSVIWCLMLSMSFGPPLFCYLFSLVLDVEPSSVSSLILWIFFRGDSLFCATSRRVEQLCVFLNFDLHVEIQNDDLLAVKYFKPMCIFFVLLTVLRRWLWCYS